MASSSSSSSRKRAWNGAWQGEFVAPATSRRAGLRAITSEIDFAFRPPTVAPTTEDPQGSVEVGEDAEIRTTTARQAGDYLTALRLSSTGATVVRGACDIKEARGLVEEDDGELDRLMWDVNDMRQEVRRLTELKKALETRAVYRAIATRDAVIKVTHAYFATFENGFERGAHAHTHERFLRSIMHRDVVMCSTFCGIDALAEQWRRYADFFHLRAYKMHSLVATSMDNWPILQISCSYTIRVTMDTLAELFPHIVSDPYFVQKVVGRRLDCESRVTFMFNPEGQIVRYDDDSDIMVAFSKLLRNPLELAKLMDGALIQETSLIGELELASHPLAIAPDWPRHSETYVQ